MRDNINDNHIVRIAPLFLLCLLSLTLFGCARNTGLATLPAYPVEQMQEGIYSRYLEAGAAIEAFDLQAVQLLESGAAKHWYPQYLATVVIAVDRDKSDAEITGWSDLLAIREKVGFNNANLHGEMLMLAMAYGLEGEKYSNEKAAELWFRLQADNRLESDSFEAPVVVCFDYQAVAQNRSGSNFEIVIPIEGTLTHEKGVLTNRPFINQNANMDAFLLAEGFRLLDGRGGAWYPGAAAYHNAARIQDYERASAVYEDATDALRRNVSYTRLNTSRDSHEYQLFGLLLCVIVVAWVASVLRRAMQKEVRRAAVLIGVLLLCWITLRLINFQLSIASDLSRYLWYGYYPFQLAISVVLLWLAWAIDKPDKIGHPIRDAQSCRGGLWPSVTNTVIGSFRGRPKAAPTRHQPKWLLSLVVLNGLLIVLVMTNDLHKLVFRLDLNYPNWSSEYGYGAGFYFVAAGCVIPLVSALVIMLIKAWRSPRRIGLVFPLACAGLLAAYAALYIMRLPAAWESDAAMVIGVFALLFFESAIRTGLIPVNSKYAPLFEHSPLSMKIEDANGNAFLSSGYALRRDGELYKSVAPPYPPSFSYDENTLLFSDRIAGGIVLWKEDITSLNRLHKEIEASVKKLQASNALLAEEEKVKRALDEEKARTLLLTLLEAEIARHTNRLASMIERLRGVSIPQDDTVRIALLLCYIKRRCNLFFRERETRSLPPEELGAYMEELSELAGHNGACIIIAYEINQALPVRRAALFYDFFYSVTDWASKSAARILAYIGYESESVTMRLTLGEEARSYRIEDELGAAIVSADGNYAMKDLDDAVGLSLSFPRGVSDA